MFASRFARTIRSILVFLALVVALSLLGSRPAASHADGEPWSIQSEPAAAAAYIASQWTRDTAAATLVTSPLYRAEMERRGRGADWPLYGLWVEAAAKLSFSFVGAVSDSQGFTYALYTARSQHPVSAEAPTSLWRIDLDPEGKVIWGELARVFDNPRVERVDVIGTSSAPSVLYVSWTASAVGEQRQAVFGVRSVAGDSYLAIHPDPSDPGRITFAQEDASGQLGPSGWTFGRQVQSTATRPFDLGRLSDDQVQTLRTYLGGIEWAPLDRGSAG